VFSPLGAVATAATKPKQITKLESISFQNLIIVEKYFKIFKDFAKQNSAPSTFGI